MEHQNDSNYNLMYYNTLLLEHTRTIYKTSYHLVLIFHPVRIAKKTSIYDVKWQAFSQRSVAAIVRP